MSAKDQMRSALDQLMGTAGRDKNTDRIQFNDFAVSKSFLLGCCPHEILYHTRMDLGKCKKVHDLALRADYEKASKTKDFFYDIEALDYLKAFVEDYDQCAEKAELQLTQNQEELITKESAALSARVYDLAEEIGKKIAKAEALGEAGEVDESFNLMMEVELLRKEKSKAELDYQESMSVYGHKNQKLRVCKVCSAFLTIADNDMRLVDHFGGKLHVGFLKIREKLAELEKTAGPRKVQLENASPRYSNNIPQTRYFLGA